MRRRRHMLEGWKEPVVSSGAINAAVCLVLRSSSALSAGLLPARRLINDNIGARVYRAAHAAMVGLSPRMAAPAIIQQFNRGSFLHERDREILYMYRSYYCSNYTMWAAARYQECTLNGGVRADQDDTYLVLTRASVSDASILLFTSSGV